MGAHLIPGWPAGAECPVLAHQRPAPIASVRADRLYRVRRVAYGQSSGATTPTDRRQWRERAMNKCCRKVMFGCCSSPAPAPPRGCSALRAMWLRRGGTAALNETVSSALCHHSARSHRRHPRPNDHDMTSRSTAVPLRFVPAGRDGGSGAAVAASRHSHFGNADEVIRGHRLFPGAAGVISLKVRCCTYT
jgi:hypothetical protein